MLEQRTVTPARRVGNQTVARTGGALARKLTGVSGMLVHILGPLRVAVDGHDLPLGGRRTKTVLAVLALEANWVVPVDDLVDAVWGGAPPASARTQIRICISAMRRSSSTFCTLSMITAAAFIGVRHATLLRSSSE